jgi:hypothetical protein
MKTRPVIVPAKSTGAAKSTGPVELDEDDEDEDDEDEEE